MIRGERGEGPVRQLYRTHTSLLATVVARSRVRGVGEVLTAATTPDTLMS